MLVIGSLVIRPGSIAGFGAYAPAGFVLEGKIYVGAETILFGLFWGAFIFAFDRALVRMPMNPVRLRPEALDLIWGDESGRPSKIANAFTRSWSDLPKLLLATFPRLVVAVASAVIFAETLLYVYFAEDLERALSANNQAQYQELLTIEEKSNETKGKQLDRQIQSTLAIVQPKIASIEQEIARLKQALDVTRSDLEVLTRGISDEASGFGGGRVLTTETEGEFELTGNVGDGPATQEIRQAIARLNSRIPFLVQEISDANVGNDRLVEEAKLNNPELRALYLEKSKLSTSPAPAEIRGIGVRLQALRNYERDMDPSTLTKIEEAPPCPSEGFAEVTCTVSRFFIPPSPNGPIVASVRWGLIFIELAPIFAKFTFVLRRRRPYDTLVAAYELVANGASVRLVAEQLARTGSVMEFAGRENTAIRTAAGSEMYLVNATIRNDRTSWRDTIRKGNPWRIGSWHLFEMRRASEEVVKMMPPQNSKGSEPLSKGDK